MSECLYVSVWMGLGSELVIGASVGKREEDGREVNIKITDIGIEVIVTLNSSLKLPSSTGGGF